MSQDLATNLINWAHRCITYQFRWNGFFLGLGGFWILVETGSICDQVLFLYISAHLLLHARIITHRLACRHTGLLNTALLARRHAGWRTLLLRLDDYDLRLLLLYAIAIAHWLTRGYACRLHARRVAHWLALGCARILYARFLAGWHALWRTHLLGDQQQHLLLLNTRWQTRRHARLYALGLTLLAITARNLKVQS